VNAPSIFRQHRAARWLIPVGVVSVLGITVAGVLVSGSESKRLPSRTAAQLIADVRAAAGRGVSGTVIVQLAPTSSASAELAAVTNRAPHFAALLGGSHAMRFWYGGPDRQRVALLDAEAETDVFRSGRDVWQWDSDDRVAVHSVLPEGGSGPMPVSTVMPQQLSRLMPQPLAAGALAAVDASTSASVGDPRIVADRLAYQLVLTPRDPGTRVGSVRIAVDAATRVPLGVEIYARGKNKPVVDVAFASIAFRSLPQALFTFTPPPGAKVTRAASGTADNPVSVRGSGWSSVVEYRLDSAGAPNAADPLMQALSPVRGQWGKGRLLDTTLVSVLVTHDGRVFAGAVDPSMLYAAAAQR
jgi:outer membrane lipoprotein-sorting protein